MSWPALIALIVLFVVGLALLVWAALPDPPPEPRHREK